MYVCGRGGCERLGQLYIGLFKYAGDFVVVAVVVARSIYRSTNPLVCSLIYRSQNPCRRCSQYPKQTGRNPSTRQPTLLLGVVVYNSFLLFILFCFFFWGMAMRSCLFRGTLFGAYVLFRVGLLFSAPCFRVGNHIFVSVCIL